MLNAGAMEGDAQDVNQEARAQHVLMDRKALYSCEADRSNMLPIELMFKLRVLKVERLGAALFC